MSSRRGKQAYRVIKIDIKKKREVWREREIRELRGQRWKLKVFPREVSKSIVGINARVIMDRKPSQVSRELR